MWAMKMRKMTAGERSGGTGEMMTMRRIEGGTRIGGHGTINTRIVIAGQTGSIVTTTTTIAEETRSIGTKTTTIAGETKSTGTTTTTTAGETSTAKKTLAERNEAVAHTTRIDEGNSGNAIAGRGAWIAATVGGTSGNVGIEIGVGAETQIPDGRGDVITSMIVRRTIGGVGTRTISTRSGFDRRLFMCI